MEKGIPKMAVYFPQIQKAHWIKTAGKFCEPLFFFFIKLLEKNYSLSDFYFYLRKIRIHSKWSEQDYTYDFILNSIILRDLCQCSIPNTANASTFKKRELHFQESYTIIVYLFSSFGFRALLIGHVLKCMHLFFNKNVLIFKLYHISCWKFLKHG